MQCCGHLRRDQRSTEIPLEPNTLSYVWHELCVTAIRTPKSYLKALPPTSTSDCRRHFVALMKSADASCITMRAGFNLERFPSAPDFQHAASPDHARQYPTYSTGQAIDPLYASFQIFGSASSSYPWLSADYIMNSVPNAQEFCETYYEPANPRTYPGGYCGSADVDYGKRIPAGYE